MWLVFRISSLKLLSKMIEIVNSLQTAVYRMHIKGPYKLHAKSIRLKCTSYFQIQANNLNFLLQGIVQFKDDS